MKREEFERLKEEEKAHLREVQRLKQRLREAERVRSIGKALGDVESAGSMDELDEALSKVQLEALEGESRLDLALESSQDAKLDKTPDPAEMEAELSKARAAELVRHMKISMGLAERDSRPASSSDSATVESPAGKSVGRGHREDSEPDDSDAETSDSNVEKTIGRMKRGDE